MKIFEFTIRNCQKLNNPDAESVGSIIRRGRREPTILLSGVNNQAMDLFQVRRWDLNMNTIEYDKKYLEYMLRDRGNQAKLVFFGFLITINLAIYSGLHQLNKASFFVPQNINSSLLVLLFLIVINFLFSYIYLREHNLDENITENIKIDYIEERKISEELRRLRDKIHKEDFCFGGTWGAMKSLMALINALPISLFWVWFWRTFIFVKMQDSYSWLILFVSFFSLVVFTILTRVEFKKREKKPRKLKPKACDVIIGLLLLIMLMILSLCFSVIKSSI
ncbi:MAG: hypothetical protein ABIH69_01830 [bacterium]